MKKIILLLTCAFFSFSSYSQYRWEVSAGATFSQLDLDTSELESEGRKAGFFVNAGYGYVMGVRAKTSIVFSLDLLQRNSELTNKLVDPESIQDISFLQVGITPKFRYLFGAGKDRFRAFLNVGPSFRINANVELGGEELDSEAYENVIIGGVYGAGFSQMIGEKFDIMVEIGAMNDFVDNFNDDFIEGNSKFFDFYARAGIRFRIYDARR
ncbi:outer membrane beta-barrel protein [Aquimarina sp. U1-2]|uniref:outer membrane beta-barrel protein n=1 Tax=Aquimarina sp. U1-2 TaxID=2823141 RepID=UPI001AECBEED|nr:outer membrane beta-barrel protein [Aquimarina sp. U1-2]MBP2832699.1 outer membrane beta-barrel protein [Aquimarina sp. U1-2]